jgi:hypothetical protein
MDALDTAPSSPRWPRPLGWASGLRLYAVLFITGAAGYLGWLPLPAGCRCCRTRWCWAPAS